MGAFAKQLQMGNLQVVAHRGYMNSGAQTSLLGGTTTRSDTRTAVTIGSSPVAGLCLAWCGWIQIPDAAEASLGNDYTIEAAFELTNPVSHYQMWWGGQQIGTIPNGCPFMISDPHYNISLAAGTGLFVRDSKTMANTSLVLPTSYAQICNTAIGDYQAYSTQASSQVEATGTMSVSGGDVNIGGGSGVPYMVLGVTQQPMPAVAIVGDSIAWGQNDTLNSTGNLGYVARGLGSVNGFQVPYVNNSVGEGCLSLDVINSSPRKRTALRYVTHVVIEMGTNDITLNSATLSQLQGYITQMAADFKSIVGPYGKRLQVAATTLLPKTTSTDNWQTLVNQTPRTGFASGGIRDQYNTWLKSIVGTILDSVIDANQYVESSVTTNVWVVNGTSNYATSDGTHPNAPACLLGAQAVNAWASQIHC